MSASHRSLALAAMMMSKFHRLVKTEGAVAVACSDFSGGFILSLVFATVSKREQQLSAISPTGKIIRPDSTATGHWHDMNQSPSKN